MSSAIIVPARFGSKRFPGKPLALLGGISMVVRTARNAQRAAEEIGDAIAIVATDDERIKEHCEESEIECVMTPIELPSGSDRALSAARMFAKQSNIMIDYIVNLQGDSPFTPSSHILACLKSLKENHDFDLTTPYISLCWDDLDALRENKETTPFSGTTLVSDSENRALWFSKNIIPAIRNESYLRERSKISPVKRHIGLYAYRTAALEKFVSLPVGQLEVLEGLEQLRCLENNMQIGCVEVQPADIAISGVDTPEDLKRAEAILEASKA